MTNPKNEPEAPAPEPVIEDTCDAENVIQALAWVEARIGGIAKRAKRSQGDDRGIQYPFRGIDAIASAAQPLLGKAGVVILPESAVIDKVLEFKQNNNPWIDMYVTVDWVIYGPGGVTDQIRSTTQGVGRDNSDKAYNKACTMAFKNLLLRVMCIGDPLDDTDGDNVQGDDHGREQPTGNGKRQTTEVDPANDPVMDTFKRVAALKGTPLGDEVKEYAAQAKKGLTAAAFNADREWMAEIGLFLDEKQKPSEDAVTEGLVDAADQLATELGATDVIPPDGPGSPPEDVKPKRSRTAKEIAADRATESGYDGSKGE